MNTEGTGSHTFKECHKTESPWNHTSTAHKEREQLGDLRSDGESSCNSGDGTGQMAHAWMFMMMISYCNNLTEIQTPNNFNNILLQEYCRILSTGVRFDLTICHNVGWTSGTKKKENIDNPVDLRNIILEHWIIHKVKIFLSGLFQPLCLIPLGWLTG